MRKHWKYWLSVLAVALLLAVAGVWWVFQTRQLPLSECSEVYRQYRHLPGVRAAFIRQMPINDTLRLDMTLLEAEDSAAFAALLIKMGKSEESVQYMMSKKHDEDDRYTGMMDEKTVFAIFPSGKAVAFFETESKKQQIILLIGNLKQTIKITKDEKNN